MRPTLILFKNLLPIDVEKSIFDPNRTLNAKVSEAKWT